MTALRSRTSATTGDITVQSDQAIDWREGPPLPAVRATTVCALLAECVRRYGGTTVLHDGERHASWRDLDAWSARLAAAWSNVLPLGGRCAILVGNGLPHLLAELACWRLGALATPIFIGFGRQRIVELLARLEPELVLVDDPQLAALVPSAVRRVDSASIWASAQQTHRRSVERAVSAGDPCLIQFTSGSTGVPRGVVLTHDNLASQQAAFALHWPEIGPGDRLASYLPWHHSFGGLAERLWSLCRGAELTIVPGGGRERQKLLDTIRRVQPTVFLSVPKIHALAVEERLFDAASVRWVFTAGAPMPCDLRQWYGEHGIPVCEGWGLTETSPSCTLTEPGIGRRGVVGWPIAGVAVGVRRADGHILVRGPNVMAGYFRQPAPTMSDGMLDSGDVGRWEADGLCLRGRADHQLKLGNGEKVCAATLEAALQAHPAILHAVVAAEPDLLVIIEAHRDAGSAEVLAVVDAVNASQEVPYLRIGGVYGVSERMGVENGHLTASLKVARGQVLESFRRWRCDGGNHFSRWR